MQQSFRKYSHVWNKNFQYHKHAKSKSFVSVWFFLFLFLFFLTISIFLSSLHSCMKQKFSISQTREIEKKISNHVNFPLQFPLIFSSYRQKNTWECKISTFSLFSEPKQRSSSILTPPYQWNKNLQSREHRAWKIEILDFSSNSPPLDWVIFPRLHQFA